MAFSPIFTDVEQEPFYLVVNLKYLLTLPHKTSIFEAKYRIREQLLNQLILRASNHASRPGINELYVSK
jgi:23S rRNA maturation-related 3'-5' exoribonuclease YhaM